MTELQMAQFVQRHPEIIHSVLLTILRIQANIQKRIQNHTNIQNGQDENQEEDEDDEEEELDADILKLKQEMKQQQYPWLMDDSNTLNDITEDEIDDEEAIIEEEIVSLLVEEFGAVINGMQTLDVLFPSSSSSDEVFQSYGSQDGIWKHVGWKPLKDLQEQVSDIPELQDLLRSLGKRPTSIGTNQYHKFNPYIENKDGAPSATINEFDRTFLNGISYSNQISQMLPSEAALLVAKTKNDTNGLHQNVTKQLFYSKLIESKLMSYQTLGWEDIPALPKKVDKNVMKNRLPSAPGGPIIICLDTSWSMVGGIRENLSKAVIIACITAAHKQNRDCYIVAFSSANNVMAIDQLSGVDNLEKILEFCSNSFVGGGTDVTGALKHAMKILHPTMHLVDDDDDDDDINTDQDEHKKLLSSRLASADILMITDGEIPNPPVSDEIMRDLTTLQQKTGMQIHGLLIGNKDVSREPLESLCTVPPHDFLLTYEQNQYWSNRGDKVSYSSPSMLQLHQIGRAHV